MTERKIDVVSDLHVDFWIDMTYNPKKQERMMRKLISFILPDVPSKTLVIAGDTGHCNQQNETFIKMLKETYDDICIVFGNHDLYMITPKIRKKYKGNSLNRLNDFIKRMNAIDGVHYLDGTMVEVDGLTIGGHGMWYDAAYAINTFVNYTEKRVQALWYETMNDSNLIRVPNKDGVLDYIDFLAESKKSKESLYEIFDKSDVILTHINPDWSGVPAHYKSPSSTFYHFDGRDILSRGGVGKTWVYGHTHDDNLDMHKDGCVLVASPLGYPSNSVGQDWDCAEWPEERRIKTMVVGQDLPSYEDLWSSEES
jgi:hypothetical protein